MTFLRPLHLVQVSLDDSVFVASAGTDALERQCAYAELLCEMRPGSSLTLLVLTQRNEAIRFTRDGATFVPVPYSRWWHLPRVYRALEALHRERPIDVVSPQNVQDEGWATLVFAKRYGIPSVGQIHFDFFSEKAREEMFGRGLRGAIRLGITEWLLPRFDELRVVGRGVHDRILERGLHRNVNVIPVPISMDAAAAPRAEPLHRSVLFVGRLVPAKNLEGWIDVARRVAANDDDARFTIVGSGPEEARLRARASELGLASRIDFTGAVPHRELGGVYRDATVFLLTSHYEGFGRVVAEAQALGVPVVAPRISGVEDIVADEETGLLAPAGDVEGLAERVIRLLGDRELAARLGGEGIVRMRRLFDPAALRRAWVELLVSAASPTVTEPPLRATLGRWRVLSSTRYSLLRALQYEQIDGLTLRGRTLDLGGGKHTDYRSLLRIEGRTDSLNIDARIRPTMLADLNRGIPVCDAAYDHVICLNTFEHIEQDTVAIAETIRVLRPGGTFHILVPFLYRVHASPSDFHRRTAFWWARHLASLGVDSANIRIEPLVWDPVASGFAIAEFARRFRGPRKRLAMLGAVIRHARWRGHERLPHRRLSDYYAEAALGYYVHGTR